MTKGLKITSDITNPTNGEVINTAFVTIYKYLVLGVSDKHINIYTRVHTTEVDFDNNCQSLNVAGINNFEISLAEATYDSSMSADYVYDLLEQELEAEGHTIVEVDK